MFRCVSTKTFASYRKTEDFWLFGPFCPKYAFLGTYIGLYGLFDALLVGWLVDGFGARAASRKTPIYFITGHRSSRRGAPLVLIKDSDFLDVELKKQIQQIQTWPVSGKVEPPPSSTALTPPPPRHLRTCLLSNHLPMLPLPCTWRASLPHQPPP